MSTESISNWINEITKEGPLPSHCNAILIGLFEGEKDYVVYFFGSADYDPEDDDWACVDANDYEPKNKYHYTGVPTTENWEVFQASVRRRKDDPLKEEVPKISDPKASKIKPCRQCLSLIPDGSHVCRFCGEAQDWRARLKLSSTILALLIAFFSVLSTALPTIKKSVIPWSDIRLITVGILPSEFSDTGPPPEWHILATNQGQRAAVLKPIANLVRDGILLPLRGEPVMIGPDESKLVVFRAEPGFIPTHPIDEPEPDSCVLEVSERTFNGKTKLHELNAKDEKWLWSSGFQFLSLHAQWAKEAKKLQLEK